MAYRRCPAISAAFFVLLLLAAALPVFAEASNVGGQVVDSAGKTLPSVTVKVFQNGAALRRQTTASDGRFFFTDLAAGAYLLQADAVGFQSLRRGFNVADGKPLELSLSMQIGNQQQTVTVTADVRVTSVLNPDPGQRVLVREQTLESNPGRPGAPISIPGLPIETASGGIKAPQYFAPGVAGDHGEPIAQYILLGNYLVSNNLSANAHGNGYADPNILVPPVIESVQIDGGAYNVREGNHAQNLAVTYGLRSQLVPFFTLTGDYRDLDAVSGLNTGAHSWVLVQASYGNGFLDRLEHRQQYKFNAFQNFRLGSHDLSLFYIGYFGTSRIPGLVPIDVTGLHDTIDPRQRDQTHTGMFAINDQWRLTGAQQLSLSSFFRTYNLSLFSNFGDGLIRQSEFRTVVDGNATYTNKVSEYVNVLAGVDFQRDNPVRDNLDHYASANPAVYGPFTKVTSNNIAIGDLSPYIAIDGSLSRRFHYDLGMRRDQIDFNNDDLLVSDHSAQKWIGFNSPKATLSFLPDQRSLLPTVSLSGGMAFFTNDPRIGTGSGQGTLVSRSHNYQLVAAKDIAGTEWRLALGHTTTEASLAKIDPDTGLQFDEGPGRLRYLTFAARHPFRLGLLQASLSKADARDLSDGTPTPEAPRLIVDAVGTLDALPFRLKARSEFEYVGAKPLGDGFTGVPVREIRAALARSFDGERMELGLNALLASGYSGQTTEVLAVLSQSRPFEQATGVRIPSYISVSLTYFFGHRSSRP